MPKEFRIYKRARKKGKPVYYVKYLPDTPQETIRSTGTTNKAEALQWALDNLGEYTTPKPERMIFREFARDFFAVNSEWATDRKVSGKRFSERHCIEKTRVLRNHIMPALGDMYLDEIKRPTIKDLRNKLSLAGYSSSTVNHALSCVKTILEYAEERELIEAVPKVERAAVRIENPRGVLTPEEVNRLFFSVEWADQRAHVASMVARSTGLRLGEILALRFSDVRMDISTKISVTINKTFDQATRKIKPSTKSGRPRVVPFPLYVVRKIEELNTVNPYPAENNPFIFWGVNPKTPADGGKIILKYLKRALSAIGITEEQRKIRNLTFHSFRHLFNSDLVNGGVAREKIQRVAGHGSDEMTQHYYHVDDLDDVRAIQDRMFYVIERETH